MAKKKLQKKIRAQMSKKNDKSATDQLQDSPPFKMASSLKKK